MSAESPTPPSRVPPSRVPPSQVPPPQVRAERLSASLPPLLVAADRVAATVAQGVHGRRRVGQGETFWQYRPYDKGDPATMIDWRQSAKSHHVFVRETEWEAAQTVWLWRDASPSMDYRSRRALPTKRERADLLLLALGSLLSRAGERFSLLGGGRRPDTGRLAFDRLAADVLAADGQAAVAARGPAAADSSLPGYEVLPKFGQVVLIGDLLAPLDDVAATVGRFAGRDIRGHLLQILDPAEETLPFRGRVRFSGMEGEAETLVGKVESARGNYRGRLADHREGLKTIAQRVGWGFSTHRTDRTAESALLALYTALAPAAAWG